MKRHWALAALLACLLPALLAFTAQPGLASFGDDSASYLVLAHRFAGDSSPAAAWAPYVGHFPPLFPLLLAIAGPDLARAHALVAVLAAFGAPAIYAYAWAIHRDRAAAFGLAALFFLLPTAWIGAKGILSEPLFLVLMLSTLAYHHARIAEGPATNRDWAVVGLLIAASLLTRLAAVPLPMAIGLRLAVAQRRQRRFAVAPWALAFLPSVAAIGTWLWLRPRLENDPYRSAALSLTKTWMAHPLEAASASEANLLDAWVSTFTADPGVSPVTRGLLAVIGIVAIVGAIRAARANRADGWYALGILALLAGWLFEDDALRRLLHPVVPVLMLLAGEAVAALASATAVPRVRLAVAVAGVAAAFLAMPALVLVAAKASEREPVLPGFPSRYADITDNYTTANIDRAHALAARQVAVLSGLEAVGQVAPPGSRVAWMRPEYVALLAGREAIPYYYAWDARRFAEEMRARKVDFIVDARLHKTDLSGASGNPSALMSSARAYARPVLSLPNIVTGGEDFALLAIDPNRLAAALQAPR